VKTILVLEDEPLVMKLLWNVLKHYHVIEATTAEQALQIFAHRDSQVDLLVTDVRLPTLSGIQVALRIRLGLPEFPFSWYQVIRLANGVLTIPLIWKRSVQDRWSSSKSRFTPRRF
jgi:CheY-like chemotaxis protein